MFRGMKRLLTVGSLVSASLVVPLASHSGASTGPPGGFASISFSINWDGARPVADPPISGQNSAHRKNVVTITAWTADSVDFVVTFPGVGGPGGVALANIDGPGVCTVRTWSHSQTTEKVAVHCAPTADYGIFHVAYTRQVAADGSYAYAQASRPTLPSYTPDPTYQYATSGKRMTVTRQSVGRYTVTIPSVVTAGATVAIGSSGSKEAVCRVASWKPTSQQQVSTQQVLVRCDAPWGVPIDSPFVIVYAQGTSILGRQLPGSWWINAKDPSRQSYIPPQSGTNAPVRIYRDAPGEYHTSDGYFVDCTSAPARSAPTPFLLQGAGEFTYVTPEGSTHNVCSLNSF